MQKHRTIPRSLLAFTFLQAAALAAASQNTPPQQQLKKYELHGQVHAADISPDEKLVATQISRSEPATSGSKYVELAQLWDFRQDRILAEVTLDELVYKEARPHRALLPPRFVRFSPDGESVLVYLDHCLHVLRRADLHELRRIQMDGPPAATRSEASWGMPRLTKLEVSPLGHKVAVAWASEIGPSAQLQVYDLDSGKQLSEWNTRGMKMGFHNPSALAWEADGQQLVVAVPNTFACSSPDNIPDIFVVDMSSGKIVLSFTTGLLVGDIAITPDAHLWAVDSNCLGAFKNHHPKMRVFDLNSGKRLKEISARPSGVRYAVSASRNGDRVVAYTGRMGVSFDWLDMAAWGVPIDQTFSVWNAHNYQGIVTSQTLGPIRWMGPSPSLNLRLSANGRFVLVDASIYELPG